MYTLRQQIEEGFSRCADSYDSAARVQVHAAERLAALIASQGSELGPGPILEIGCGTGNLTLPLLAALPEREIVASDLSAAMLARCQEKLQAACGTLPARVALQVADGERINDRDRFAAIVSSFTMQWFLDLESAIVRLTKALTPGGQLYLSVPGSGSFKQWQALCQDAGVPFTGNPLPTVELFQAICSKHNFQLEVSQEEIQWTFAGARDFLHNLKALGASTSMSGLSLTPRQIAALLRQAENVYGQSFPLTYEVLYVRISRMSSISRPSSVATANSMENTK